MKIFASDYDGTFIRSNPVSGEIENNIREVARWRASGNLFLFATGRDLRDMIDFMYDGLVCDYYVCQNGGLIATQSGEIILEQVLPQDTADEIMAMISGITAKNLWSSNSKIAFEMESSEVALKTAEMFAGKLEGKATVFANEQIVDINALGVTKATGIALIAKKYNIPDRKIYCMGDSHNDLPMLMAYNGITLPGVDARVRSEADIVHSSVGSTLKWLTSINMGGLS